MIHVLIFAVGFFLFSCGDKEGGKDEVPVSNPPQGNPQPTPQPTPSPGGGGSNPFPIPLPPGDGQNPFPNPCDTVPFPIPGCGGNPSPTPQPTPGPSPTPQPAPSPDPGTIGEKETFLRFHNLKRCWHSAPAIVWNQQLADEARAYASRCVFAHDSSNGGRFGENLAMGYPDLVKSQDAWYMEYLKYDFNAGQFSPATGHFTQLVWIGSTELGCARVQCPQGPYDICRYKPAGNVIGRFKENVKPLKDDISQCGLN